MSVPMSLASSISLCLLVIMAFGGGEGGEGCLVCVVGLCKNTVRKVLFQEQMRRNMSSMMFSCMSKSEMEGVSKSECGVSQYRSLSKRQFQARMFTQHAR